MTSHTFALRPDLSTRDVLRIVRAALADAIETLDPDTVTWEVERRRTKPFVGPGVRSKTTGTRYVFGIGTPSRSTLVGHYVVGSGEVMLVFPNHYAGWSRAGWYDRLRVTIWDRLVHGMHGSDRIVVQPSKVPFHDIEAV